LGLNIVLVLGLVGMSFMSVHAQSTTLGNISGTVRDEKGAVVPNAEVVISEEGTELTRTVTADDNGFYLVTGLRPGRYTVSTSPQGFKKTVASGVELHVTENKVVNLEVQVGQ